MKNKDVIKKVLSFVSKYKLYIAASVLFALVSSLGALYVPVLIGKGIDLIIGKGNVDFSGVIKVLVEVAVIIIVCAASQWIMNSCNNKITFNVVRDMRRKAFAKIERLPISYIDSHPTGDVVSRVIADVDQFADGLLMGFTQFFTGVVTIVGTLAFMLYINVWIT
ncbi:MAG: ABC transporter ATP-binding protein, partial [Eubacterium sp.]|nr:ABC transporter ATP-binding protein [Eubacterium sp.]